MKAAQRKFFTPKGFTLIELLVVITIIATLAVTVFVALNPAGRLEEARDARRISDVDSILTAIHQSIVDNGGTIPGSLTAGTEYQLGTAASGCQINTGGCNVLVAQDACKDLTTDLAKYLKTIPVDPSAPTGETGYSVGVDSNGIVTVKACLKEGTNNISASR